MAPIPVIPVRNSDEGESLTKLAPVFMCGDKLLSCSIRDPGRRQMTSDFRFRGTEAECGTYFVYAQEAFLFGL